MSVEDDVRSLSARVSKLTTAIERSCTAQVESAEWCSQTQSDVATLMADVRAMSRRMDALAKAVSKLTGLLDGREELKLTSAYPFASGAYDEDIARMYAEGATDRDIARALGCGPMTISRRRVAIGIKGRRADAHWTEREDAVLRERAKAYTTWAEVAEGMEGRSAQGCCRRGRKLGVSLRPAWRPWSAEDEQYLREVWESCAESTEAIARRLRRTEKAVRQRARELGLTASGRRLREMSRREASRFWAKGETR